MIGRREPPKAEVDQAAPKSFDDFDLRLGDIMRGERATMGKSLLDVQRELKIKASFVAAIENADASAFETPGFVAGYVRSYARYLGLEPEWAFETFCRESSFVPATASTKLGDKSAPKPKGPVFRNQTQSNTGGFDPFAAPSVSFVPKAASPFSSIEPRAIGSMLVLLGLIGAVGYGGWSVLQEVQRVEVTPVDRAPTAIAQVDPIAIPAPQNDDPSQIAQPAQVTGDPVGRLYRPKPLEAPIMIARDGPIAAQDPAEVGVLPAATRLASSPPILPGAAPQLAQRAEVQGPPVAIGDDPISLAVTEALGGEALPGAPQVTENVPEVVLVAVDPAWVRVRAADGSVLLEKILNPGDTFVVPQTEEPATLRTGAAGAVFFAVNGQTYGPAGGNGEVVDKIALNSPNLTQSFALADPNGGDREKQAVQIAEAMLTAPLTPLDGPEGETVPAE